MGRIPDVVVEPYVRFLVKPLPTGFHQKQPVPQKTVGKKDSFKYINKLQIKKNYKYFRITDFFKNIFSLSCLPRSREGTTLTADSLALDSPWLLVVVIFPLSRL